MVLHDDNHTLYRVLVAGILLLPAAMGFAENGLWRGTTFRYSILYFCREYYAVDGWMRGWMNKLPYALLKHLAMTPFWCTLSGKVKYD